MSELAKAVLLDRDGVINRLLLERGPRETPLHPTEFELLPGVREALTNLRKTTARLIVITNQPNVAKGKTSLEHHYAIEQYMHGLIGPPLLDAVYTCLHRAEDGCSCHKPKPGLLLQAAVEHHLDLSQSVMVGDSSSDIEAGCAAGCHTVFISPHGEAGSLLEAVPLVMALLKE